MPDMRPSRAREFTCLVVFVFGFLGGAVAVCFGGVKAYRWHRANVARLRFAECILAIPQARPLTVADVEVCAK